MNLEKVCTGNPIKADIRPQSLKLSALLDDLFSGARWCWCYVYQTLMPIIPRLLMGTSTRQFVCWICTLQPYGMIFALHAHF